MSMVMRLERDLDHETALDHALTVGGPGAGLYDRRLVGMLGGHVRAQLVLLEHEHVRVDRHVPHHRDLGAGGIPERRRVLPYRLVGPERRGSVRAGALSA